MNEPVRHGLIGYGLGGRLFHAPFIEAANGIELAGVVTRSPQRRAQLQADFLDVPCFETAADLLASGVESVTITTPPETRRELVLQALDAGVHVVADKPFAPDADSAVELVEAGRAANVILSVFHNRRYDADARTLHRLFETGSLGNVWRLHSRFDLNLPETLDGGPAGGLLRDTGAHLVDQALWLLGDVSAVSATLNWIERDRERIDGGFVITLRHTSGAVSYLSSSKVNRVTSKTLLVYGQLGSYEAAGTDVQFAALLAGKRPADDRLSWGFEDESNWGVLHTAEGTRTIPSEQGAYFRFYERFAAAVRGTATPPTPGADAIRTLQILDAARLSDAQERWVLPLASV
jgi:predicted dehydrogenase